MMMIRFERHPGGWLAGIACFGLTMAAIPTAAAPATMLLIPICGDPSHLIEIPLGDGQRPRQDCPAGCHAICARRSLLEDDANDL